MIAESKTRRSKESTAQQLKAAEDKAIVLSHSRKALYKCRHAIMHDEKNKIERSGPSANIHVCRRRIIRLMTKMFLRNK